MSKEPKKNIAMYLRKSRDEGDCEDVLSKHRNTLVNLAKSNGWSYELDDIYEEVVSGEKLEQRNKMKELLKNVDQNMYDAVLVMDIDRLGRGDMVDWAMIKKVLKDSETLIVTPNKTYDLETDGDDLIFNIESILAQLELKTIKRRMQRGKRAEAEKGKWVNGFPPFPYYYDSSTRTLRVDEGKRHYYRTMVQMYIKGENLTDIAKWLTDNLPTKYNITNTEDKRKGWSVVSVKRILASEVHLGVIVYGKFKKRKVKEMLPREDWQRSNGEHESLKTEEEHKLIMARIAKCKTINPKARARSLPLSGIMYCKKCGNRMGIKYIRENTWKAYCGHKDSNNNLCKQKSKQFDENFIRKIYETVINIDDETLISQGQMQDRMVSVRPQYEAKCKELAKNEQALDRLFELWEEGNIDKRALLERKAVREVGMKKLQAEIQRLALLMETEASKISVPEMKKRISKFKKDWLQLTSIKDRNRLLESIVDRIYYNRERKNIDIDIRFY